MLFTNVGIAIITYNRPNFLESCLNSVFNFPTFNAEIAVFDDASLDNSCEIASKYCKYFSGKSNEGVVVNKNRALYYFTEISPKDIIIILEDDVNVESCNWISDWTDAASKYGHMNYIPPWFFDPSLSDNFVSGLGSVADPYIFTLVTGQCTSVRADLIRSSVGYLNPLFKGYGHGHVDWTLRFINLDYGGRHTSSGHNFFLGIEGGILALQSPSNKDVDELNKNQTTFIHLQNERHLFVEKPWLSDSDKTKFLEPFNLP